MIKHNYYDEDPSQFDVSEQVRSFYPKSWWVIQHEKEGEQVFFLLGLGDVVI